MTTTDTGILRRKPMNAIVTVVGQDRVGISAAVCTLLAENRVNILDISQTILQGSFTMVMAVDVGQAPIGELRQRLERLGEDMGISICIQREEIFDAMHHI
jgi:ACT domain-containing protein